MRGSGPLNSSSKSVIESLCNGNATVVLYAHASTFMFYAHTNLCATNFTASYHHNIQQTTTGICPALFFSFVSPTTNNTFIRHWMNKVNGKTILVLVRITDLLVDFKVNKIQAETTKIKDFVVSDFDAFNKRMT